MRNYSIVGRSRDAAERGIGSLANKTSNQVVSTSSGYSGVLITSTKVTIPARADDWLFISCGIIIGAEAIDVVGYIMTMTAADASINLCSAVGGATVRQGNTYMSSGIGYNYGVATMYKVVPGDLVATAASGGLEHTGWTVSVGLWGGTGSAVAKTFQGAANSKTWLSVINMGPEDRPSTLTSQHVGYSSGRTEPRAWRSWPD